MRRSPGRRATWALSALLVAAPLRPGEPVAGSPREGAGRPPAAQGRPAADHEAALAEIFAPWDRPDSPGCAVGVARDGELILARGFGSANLEHGIPIDADSVLPIGSNSKQFGAALAALLAGEGRLDLDADLRTYLPELPDYGARLTTRHLVHHTGGLRDYQALRMLSGVPPQHLDAAQVFGLLARQRALDAMPGERFDYDNSGYVLLRFVLERVSGTTLPELARERLFAPLGMSSTRWLEADHAVVVPRRATPYAGNAADGYTAHPGSSVMASGGIVTTLGDLARWHAFLLGARTAPLPAALPRQLLTAGALNGGEPVPYAWGMFLGEHRGRRIVWHAGTGPGFVADMVLFPAERLSVFCLCNGVIDSRALSRRVADLFLEGAGGGPAPVTASEALRPAPTPGRETGGGSPVRLSPPVLAALAGRYRDADSGSIWELAVEGGDVALRTGRFRIAFRAVAPDALAASEPGWEDWLVRFEPARDGAVPRLRLFEAGEETARYERLPAALPPERLLPYTGRYASAELGAVYILAVEGGRLQLHTPVQPNGTLLYLGGESFVLPTEWFDVRFEFVRGPGGAVEGFAVGTGEANDIGFRREPAPCPVEPSNSG